MLFCCILRWCLPRRLAAVVGSCAVACIKFYGALVPRGDDADGSMAHIGGHSLVVLVQVGSKS